MRSFSVCDLCQWIRCFRIVPEYGREVDKMRKLLALCLALILAMPLITSALGDRTPEPRSWRYVGAMRVVNCNEYVSLREQPYKKSKALAKVPLGAIVYNCSSIPQKKSFYYCEYEVGHFFEHGLVTRKIADHFLMGNRLGKFQILIP